MVDLDWEKIEPLVQSALEEDLGSGDITSVWVVPERSESQGRLMAKEEGIVAGLEVAALAFRKMDPRIGFTSCQCDGDRVLPGSTIAEVFGPVRGILSSERTAINLLQRMSGIATATAAYVSAVEGTGAKVMDTRKTTPGLRMLEKYAVRMGGGVNHRFGLYDMVLIKENHIEVAGGILKAVQRVKERMTASGPGGREGIAVEVETRSLEEVQEALSAGVDRIMLDNMTCEEMRKAVRIIRGQGDGRPGIEASGMVTLTNIREVAETGVDLISIGALTHSPKALDISLLLER